MTDRKKLCTITVEQTSKAGALQVSQDATHVSEEKRKKFIIKFSSKDWSNILPEDDDELSIFIKQGNDENILKNLIFILCHIK